MPWSRPEAAGQTVSPAQGSAPTLPGEEGSTGFLLTRRELQAGSHTSFNEHLLPSSSKSHLALFCKDSVWRAGSQFCSSDHFVSREGSLGA